MFKKTMCLVFIISVQSVSDIAVTSEARKNLQLTVFNDFGIIKDSRLINLPKGSNRIRFEEVSAAIQASSVFLEWPQQTEINMVSQSYEYDLVSAQKLMEKYIGKELEVIPRKEIWKDSTPKTVELLGVHGNAPVFRVGTKITYGDIGQILFPYVPDNLYVKPTLIWDIQSSKRQETELTATYMTDGVSWNSGYVLHVDLRNGSGLFSGWITIDNRSGMNFKNANVTCVSGRVPRIKVTDPNSANVQSLRKSRNVSDDFFLYTIQDSLTIADNQAKQIEWIPQVKVRFSQSHSLDFNSEQGRDNINGSVNVDIENTEANGVGLPLPEGVIRVFKKDSQGKDWFVGEDYIRSTPAKKIFSARVASTTDLYGEKIRTDKNSDDKDVSYTITVSNKKDAGLTVVVRDYIPYNKIQNSSLQYQTYNDFIEWTLKVPAKGSNRISYSLSKKK